MAAERRLTIADRQIEAAVDTAMREWLDSARVLIIAEAAQQLGITAAANRGKHRRLKRQMQHPEAPAETPMRTPGIPNPEAAVQAATAAYNDWRRTLDNNVLPAISIAFGDAFQQYRLANRDTGSFTPQMQYMETVADRLKIWPAEAFEKLRPELIEALANAETIEQITDRVGMVLGIDKDQRAIKARINEIEAAIDEPEAYGLDSGDIKSLRAERRALWEQHDAEESQWRWKARRIARTEAHGAIEAGSLAGARQSAAESGETWHKRWICVTGDTRIRADGISFVARRHHEGTIVRIRTASGATLSTTPEHRVLTNRGWIRADVLDVGNDLFHVGVGDTSWTPDVSADPPSIAETFDALVAASPVEVRTVLGGVDLHGDPVHSQVEVVATDSDLAADFVPGITERGVDLILPSADVLSEMVMLGASAGDDRRVRLGSTFELGGSLAGSRSAVLGGLATGSQSSSGAAVAALDPSIVEDSDDGLFRYVECDCQSAKCVPIEVSANHVCCDSGSVGTTAFDVDRVRGSDGVVQPVGLREGARHPELFDVPGDTTAGRPKPAADLGGRELLVDVHADEIVGIEVEAFSGHVYDLTTSSGWFEANGLVIHNCTDDTRTRASHRVADGQTVPLDEKFRVGGFLLDFPGDPITIAPHETINCLTDPDTPIATDRGPKRVADIQIGDRVLTHRGRFRPVVRLAPSRTHSGDVVCLDVGDGVLRLTENHPVLTDQGWVIAGELSRGRIVLCASPIELGHGFEEPSLLGERRSSARTTSATDPDGPVRDECGMALLDDEVWEQCRAQLGRLRVGDLPAEHLGPAVLERLPIRVDDPDTGDLVEKPDDALVAVHRQNLRVVVEGPSGVLSLAARTTDGDRSLAVDESSDVGGSDGIEFHPTILPRTVVRYWVERADQVQLFNFAVDEDESYVANGIVVHNCRCTMLIYHDDALQDELQGPDGSLGEIRPGGVRIGPDDPDKVQEAVDRVVEVEHREPPADPDARGEHFGQTTPEPPEPVELTEERETPIGPAPDLASFTDAELLELAREKINSDDGVYEQALAEYDRRIEAQDD